MMMTGRGRISPNKNINGKWQLCIVSQNKKKESASLLYKTIANDTSHSSNKCVNSNIVELDISYYLNVIVLLAKENKYKRLPCYTHVKGVGVWDPLSILSKLYYCNKKTHWRSGLCHKYEQKRSCTGRCKFRK